MSRLGSAIPEKATYDDYVLTVPKNTTKKYNVMRFSGGDQMDVQKWASARITRDMSAKKIYQEEEVYPEFGAGSEYGRKQREQARKLKYGMRQSKFKVENQPWQLSVTTTAKAPYSAKNKNKDKMITVTKDFAGKKEGGIGDSSMYFVFMQRPNSTFEAYPVEAWYSFTRKIKHRTLTDEEAEAEWDKRDKIMNHLNFMARKRLQLEEEQDEEEGQKKSTKKKKDPEKAGKSEKEANNGLVIHDEDELLMSESDGSSDEDKAQKEKRSKKQKKIKEEEDHEAADEALEDSDDGDGEGAEQDYNSDISSEEETANDSRIVPKGLDEQESSSSSEEEETKPDANLDKKQKKKKGSGDEMSSSGDSDVDSDIEKESSALLVGGRKTPTKIKKESGSNSRSSTPNSELLTGAGTKKKLQEVAKRLETTGRTSPKVPGLLGKRQAGGETSHVSNIKRQKISGTGSGSNTPSKDSSQNVISEESVRRYLQHKPITTKDLLKKIKSKTTGLSSEQIVNTVARILKRLNPEQKKISGKIHLFLKQS